MASLSHIAVGLVTAKHCLSDVSAQQSQRLRAMFWMCTLAMLPDADVLTFVWGIPYEAPLGHRGAAHSLVVALAFALLCAPLLKTYFQISFTRGALLGFVTIASHGLLDTLTDGGYGVALLWPFSDERFFAPWQPIPVSPIGFEFLSARGWMVFCTEFVYCSPLVLYALWPKKKS